LFSTTGEDENHGQKTDRSIGGMKVSHSMVDSMSVRWMASHADAFRDSLQQNCVVKANTKYDATIPRNNVHQTNSSPQYLSTPYKKSFLND
jgi:hypothetical protein